ncbi:hypothetical protein BD324DRAFT_382416 [Kockovaella imperatae]|uniref:RRM Nup35-type domain-containing protein n=1 Tax=Kockovaella imperatae TaxID=4999 RepID=A0A1Y1UHK8_9TREE|nr:hypothetical protein BD324DRAFT_382416 [Kockovaella imperatae]ORX37538.1 hypothetical protein BD324DRAFT_382416 [Kockovaella imperatae]
MPDIEETLSPLSMSSLSMLMLCDYLADTHLSVSSPRNPRTSRATPSMSMAMDEDAPPTASLHDLAATPTSNAMRSSSSLPTAQSPPSMSSSSFSLPAPSSLTAGPSTTSLHVFGPPMDQLGLLQPYFEQIGSVQSYIPGPEGSNWYVVTFHSPTSALYALRRHGEIINGRWMLGFKVAGPGSTAGCTLVDGHGPSSGQASQNGHGGNSNGEIMSRPGPGTPLRIQNTSVLKQKPAAVKAKSTESFAWDESEESKGLVNKAAEWLFGR